ncbi:MAG: hypothetical protein ACXW2P_10910, partial [Thermoanaerobaculia bacterium]
MISIALLGLWSWALPKVFPELAKKPEPAKVETAPRTPATATTTTGTSASTAAAAAPSATLTTAAPQTPV